MGNVDAVPVASQVKSVVQVARGEREAALETQRRFTQQCIGVSQVRAAIESSQGDVAAAAETQRQFLETSRRVLDRSDLYDAVPGLSQLKSSALERHGNAEAAAEVRRNFTRRCLGVSQAQSAYEAVWQKRREAAIERQREFFEYSGAVVDKVPVIGHAKAFVHHALGQHHRADEALHAANSSVSSGFRSLETAFRDITTPGGIRRRSETFSEASLEPAGPLTHAEINQCTYRFDVQREQCLSFTACPICMQDFNEGDQGITLRCFHIFHSTCAERWFQQTGNCPVCRVQVHGGSEFRGEDGADFRVEA